MQSDFTKALSFLTITTSLILLMGAFIILILYLHKKRQEKNIQLLNEMKISFDNELLRIQLEMQDQTFQDISRQIHDNISLSLTLAKLKLSSLLPNHIPEIQHPIEIIGEAINDLTDLSRSMNSDIIKDCGLISALSMEIKRIEKLHNIKFDVTLTGKPTFFDAKQELYLFRIMQEAINNVIKHSNATAVKIELQYRDDCLIINIADNGKGFSINRDEKNKFSFPSSGLKSIIKRVEFFNGKMQIFSKPEEGTCLHLTLPIPKQL